MSKRCPTCRTVVDDDARFCPNCPYTFPDEDEPQHAPVGTVPTQWTPAPLVGALLAVCVLFGGWFFFFSSAQKANDANEVGMGRPGHGQTAPSTHTASGAALAGQAHTDLSRGDMGERLRGVSNPSLPGPSAQPDEEKEPPVVSISVEPPQKAARPVKEWRLRGYVYDLMTFKPVAHCRMVLSDVNTNARFETSTGADGRYRAILPPLPDRGYLVSVSQAGYAPNYLNPGTEGVREKPLEERQALCRDLATVVVQPASLEPHGGDPLVTDFFIAPLTCR